MINSNEKGGEGVVIIDTITRGTQANKQFETYGNKGPDTEAEDCEEVRREIISYYGIPTDHVFSIRDNKLSKKRSSRAFTLVFMDTGESYYVDGVTAHHTLMEYLNKKIGDKMNFDEEDNGSLNFTSVHGFLDPDGFVDSEDVQKKARELGRETITWFVRRKVDSPKGPPVAIPVSPIQS